MKLIGNFLSPYVRRVAITLNLLDRPFDMETVLVFKTPERVAAHSPLTRIPTLILDDGEVLVESTAILDALDDLAGPEKALTPPAGAPRRKVMKITAIAVGTMEKAQWAYYEGLFRPQAIVHQPWIEHNEKQVLAGLSYLDEAAKAAGGGWLAGTDRLSQADVSAAVAFTFVNACRPKLEIPGRFARIEAFTARMEGLEAFKAAPLPAPE